jgi:hypothetical protein
MDNMLFVWLLLALGLLVAMNLWQLVAFHRVKSGLQRLFYEFTTPEREGEKSGLDIFMETLAHNIGHSAFTQVRSMMANSASKDARAEKAVDSAINQDLLAQANPVIGALLDSMPALRKVIRRNPALAELAIDKIMSRAQSGPGVETKGNHDSSTTISIT